MQPAHRSAGGSDGACLAEASEGPPSSEASVGGPKIRESRFSVYYSQEQRRSRRPSFSHGGNGGNGGNGIHTEGTRITGKTEKILDPVFSVTPVPSVLNPFASGSPRFLRVESRCPRVSPVSSH